MNSKDTNKSSEELRKEVLIELDKVDTDLDQFQVRMTPGQLLDDAIFYPNGASPGAAFDHLKRNPVGATFLALGTLLLMEDENHITYEQSSRSRFAGTLESARLQMKLGAEETRDTISDLKGDASQMVNSARSKARAMVGGPKDKLEDAKAEIGAALDRSKNRVDEMTENLREQRKSSGQVEDFETSSADKLPFKGYTNDYDPETDQRRETTIEDAKAAFGPEDSGSRLDDLKDKASETLSSVSDSASRKSEEIRSEAQRNLSEGSEKVGDKFDELKSRASGAFDEARDKFEDVKDNLTSRFSGSEGDRGGEESSFKDRLGGINEKVSGVVGSAREKMNVEGIRSRAQDGVRTVRNLDPMTYMAIGAGLGAITGAALPVSEREQQFVEENLAGTMSDFSRDLENALNESSSLLKDLVIGELKSAGADMLRR